MSLASGTRLGPYEVLGLIGAGGMGEVYKARDTRLDRTVAIKVLPAELSADPERRARFEREARAVAALAHPHICTIHDVGEAALPSPEFVAAEQRDGRIPSPESPPSPNGLPAGFGAASPAACPLPLVPVHYLVMEHLSGQTLAERLSRGALPLGEALEIAAQMADALDAAHRHGIIHRDLKPGNVMLTAGGPGRSGKPSAKLLDFGLARLTEHDEAEGREGAAVASTLTDSLTVRGTVMGTLPYMAPELLEGKRADARSDLWALGAMIYEMLTGRRAFAGDNSASLIGSIMNTEPPALAEQQPLTPPAIEHVVTKCLAKRPDDRWDSAHDVADELRWIAEAAASTRHAAAPGDQPAATPRPRRRAWLVHPAWAAACVVLLALLGRQYIGIPDSPPSGRTTVRQVVHMDVVVPADMPLWLDPEGYPPSFAIAPDGSSMAYTCARGASTQLCLRRFDRSEVVPVAGSEAARYPVYASDGRSIVFCVARDTTCEGGGAIRTVSLADGRVEAAGIVPNELPYVSHMGWLDDTALLVGGYGGTWEVPIGGGAATRLLSPDAAKGEQAFTFASALPDGRRLIASVGGGVTPEVRVISLDSGDQRVLLRNVLRSWYLPTEHLLYHDVTSGTNMIAAFDPDTLALGAAVELPEPVRVFWRRPGLAISANGALLYVPALADRVLAWVDRERREVPAVPDKGSWGYVRIHPDGRRAAVDVVPDRGLPRIVVVDLDRGVSTTAASSAWNPVWTHDGSKLAYLDVPSLSAVLWKPADGSGPPETIYRGYAENIGSVSRDGHFALTTRTPDPPRFAIGVLSRSGAGWSVRPFLPIAGDASPHSYSSPRFSPNGRWLAYTSNESGRWEVYIRAYPGGGQLTRVSREGGYGPVWSRDGRELFYRNGERFYTVPVSSASPPALGAPRLIFSGPYLDWGPLGPADYDVSPDGHRFLVVRVSDEERAPRRFHLVQNWFGELKAKVPAAPDMEERPVR